MYNVMKKFLTCEDGAVTVDWVVLTAAVVGLAAGGMSSIQSATVTLSSTTATNVSTVQVDNGN